MIKNLLIVLFFTFSSFIYGQGVSAPQNDETKFPIGAQIQQNVTTRNFNSIWGFIQMIVVFAIIILAIYGLFFFIRRSSKSTVEEGDIIKLVDNKSLGQNKFLHLIKISEEYYLVASSEGGVNLLSKIDDKEAVSKLDLEVSESGVKNKNFSEMIGGGEIKNPLDFLKIQKNRIKKM